MQTRQESNLLAEKVPSPPDLVCWKVWGGNGQIDSPVSIPGLHGHLFSQPCDSDRGGDLYYLSACGSGALARLCIADVTGHGESVATFSGWLEEVFAKHIHRASPAAVLREVNQRAASRGLEVMSTAVCLSYNSLNGWLSYCSAGHPPIRLCRAGESDWVPLYVRDDPDGRLYNLPLAVDETSRYTIGELQLVPGDRLLIHTDGLTESGVVHDGIRSEALWEGGHLPGSDAEVPQVMDAIQTAARLAEGVPREDDDVTVMVLEAQPYQASGRYALFVKNNLYRIAQAMVRSNR